MKERSKSRALLEARCPQCREGKLFSHSALSLTKFDKMYDHCPVCGLRYEVEPGFFFVSMYISYAFSVAALAVMGVVLYYVFDDPPTWVYIVSVPLTVLFLLPFLFRASRVLTMYTISGVKYRGAEGSTE